MSIFAPQNVMGPAHRGGVIQQLAQGAAQNVMRRQKLKALLMHTAGQAGGHSIGGGQPFRVSTMGHATGVRGAVQRPLQAAQGVGLGAATQSFANQADPLSLPDPGTPDLPSLPDATDPTQSQSSTQPGPVADNGPAADSAPAPQLGPGGGGSALTGATGTSSTINNGGTVGDITQATTLVPIGGGLFYDPATDSIRGGGPVALHSGNAQQSALAGRPV